MTQAMTQAMTHDGVAIVHAIVQAKAHAMSQAIVHDRLGPFHFLCYGACLTRVMAWIKA